MPNLASFHRYWIGSVQNLKKTRRQCIPILYGDVDDDLMASINVNKDTEKREEIVKVFERYFGPCQNLIEVQPEIIEFSWTYRHFDTRPI